MRQAVQNDTIVGVDISADYIRAVQVERVDHDYVLRNIGIEKTPEGSFDQGHIIDTKAITLALKKLFKDRKFDTNRVATAIRGKGVVSRILTFPSMPQQRLRRLIENEVDRYVMFSDQDKVVFYYPLEEFDEYDRRKVNVLLVVAQKSMCNAYHKAFRDAGLELTGIDFSTFAILRELNNSADSAYSGETLALVLDNQGATLNIFHNDTLRFLRHIRLEKSKNLTNGFMDRVITEVMLSIDYYETMNERGSSIGKIVTSLGAPGAEQISDALAASLEDKPVDKHNPFSNIKVDIDKFPPQIMEKVDTSFLTSVGIALKGQEVRLLPFEIDLLPQEIHEARTFTGQVKAFALMAAVMLLVLSILWTFMNFNVKKLDAERQSLQNQIKDKGTQLQAYEVKRKKFDALNPVATDVQVTYDWSMLTEEIKKVVPKTVQLTDMVVTSPDSIELRGVAESNSSILNFVQALKKSPAFDNVQRGPINPTKVFDKNYVSFSIICKYRKAESN